MVMVDVSTPPSGTRPDGVLVFGKSLYRSVENAVLVLCESCVNPVSACIGLTFCSYARKMQVYTSVKHSKTSIWYRLC
jgi:hypothetical protein